MGKEKVEIIIDAKDSASKKIGAVNRALGGMASVATGMIAANVLTGVARGMASLGTAAISVESAMAGVTKTTDGLVDNMGNLTYAGEVLKSGFRELAKEIPMSVEELMHIGELGGQLGITQDNLLDFTETIAALGVTTNLSTEDAAMSLAQLMNVMGTNQKDIDKLGSVIVDLGNNFATTEADIVAFASRIAGAGEIAGLSEADVMGISAAFSSVGIEAEAGGTAVQKVLMAMNQAVAGGIGTGEIIDNTEAIAKMQEKYVNATGKLRGFEASLEMSSEALQSEYDAFIAAGGAADKWGEQLGDKNRLKLWNAMRDMQEYEQALSNLKARHGEVMAGEPGKLGLFAAAAGMSAAEFQAAWGVDPAKAFQAFVEGLGAAGDDAINILDQLDLQDQRLIRSFLSLGKAGDLLGDSIDRGTAAWGENNALTKEAEQRYRTTAAQIEIFKNRIRDVAITIGDALLPILNGMLLALTPVVETFGNFVKYIAAIVTDGDTLNDYLSKLPEPLQGIAKAAGEAVLAFSNFAKAAEEKIVPAIAKVKKAYDEGGLADIFSDIIEPQWIDWATQMSESTAEFEKWSTAPETSKQYRQIGRNLGKLIVEGMRGLFLGTEEEEDGPDSAMTTLTGTLGDAISARSEAISALGAEIANGTITGMIDEMGGELDSTQKNALTENMKVLFGAINPIELGKYVWGIVGRGLMGLAYGSMRTGESIRGFQSGGMVPGLIGAPQLAMVHGGEMVLNPAQQSVINNYFNQTVNTRAEQSSVVQDFNMLKSLAGVA